MPSPFHSRRRPTNTQSTHVRRAGLTDLQACRIIENDSAWLFAEHGMDGITDDPSVDLATLARAQADGRLWIAADEDDVPVGFALVITVDGLPHLQELDVLTRWHRRGIGRQLIDAIVADARAAGHPALTLTTFTDVPWNAPYYARLGFEPVADAALTPELREVYEHEAPGGTTLNPRIAMRLDLGSAQT